MLRHDYTERQWSSLLFLSICRKTRNVTVTSADLCCNSDSDITGGIAVDNVIFWKGEQLLVKFQMKQKYNLSSLYTVTAFLESWMMIKIMQEYFVVYLKQSYVLGSDQVFILNVIWKLCRKRDNSLLCKTFPTLWDIEDPWSQPTKGW